MVTRTTARRRYIPVRPRTRQRINNVKGRGVMSGNMPALTRPIVLRGRGPIPASVITKLRYTDYVISSGATLGHVWNINSIYDPDRTGIGHQPYGHDTYETLYNRYRVISFSYDITFTNLNTANNSAYLASIYLSNTGSAASSHSLIIESPNVQTKVVQGQTRFKGTIYPNKVTGVELAKYKSDDLYAGVFGASPPEIITLQTLHSQLSYAVTPANTVTTNVVFVYEVEMFDPKELSQS